jgi:hypothetical protein
MAAKSLESEVTWAGDALMLSLETKAVNIPALSSALPAVSLRFIPNQQRIKTLDCEHQLHHDVCSVA